MLARKFGIVGGSQLGNEIPETIAAPQSIHAFKALGPNVLWTFAVLYSMRDAEGYTRTSCAAIAAALNRDETRSTRRDVEKLFAAGLIGGNHDKAVGLLTIKVYDPAEIAAGRVVAPSPQRELDLDGPEEVTGGADFRAPESPPHTMVHGNINLNPSTMVHGGADVLAPESPPPADPDAAAVLGLLERERRYRFPSAAPQRVAVALPPIPAAPTNVEGLTQELHRKLNGQTDKVYLRKIAEAIAAGGMDVDRVRGIIGEVMDDPSAMSKGKVFTHRMKKAYPTSSVWQKAN